MESSFELSLARLRPRDELFYVSRSRTVLATGRDGFIHGHRLQAASIRLELSEEKSSDAGGRRLQNLAGRQPTMLRRRSS